MIGEEGKEPLKNALEEKPFSCEKCQKKFSQIRQLKRHEERDKCGIKQCRFCDKTFKKLKRLTVHERTHTKPFYCRYCEKRLSQR